MIRDPKLFVAFFKKRYSELNTEVNIIVTMHPSVRMKILYKPEPQLFIVDWLSRQACQPPTRAEVQKELQWYWSFIDEIAIIDVIAMKGERIIIPSPIQWKALNNLHMNYVG